jgi:16S rRNA (adenine1518-N6/adenine1519-N6)-dimethyltransferase
MKGAKLGQHFLVNKNVAEKIARKFLQHISKAEQHPILEIGPGKGILTDLLIKYRQGNLFTAVELDNSLFYKLKNKYHNSKDVEFLNRDILKIDLARLFPTENQMVHVAGNVPYHISKEIMDWVIKHHHKIQSATFMVQKEFADKLLPTAKQDQTNAQSILLNTIFDIQKDFDVQPGSFSPQPKVKSTVFSIEKPPEIQFGTIDYHEFYQFLKECFKNRRKTFINNIGNATNTEKLWEFFEENQINPKIRAEQLLKEDFLLIFTCLRHPVIH